LQLLLLLLQLLPRDAVFTDRCTLASIRDQPQCVQGAVLGRARMFIRVRFPSALWALGDSQQPAPAPPAPPPCESLQ
jgi:hypothetical protein